MSILFDDIKTVKQQIKTLHFDQAFATLKSSARPEDDFTKQHVFFKALTSIPQNELSKLGLKPIKIAIIGTSTTDYLYETLKVRLALDGLDANIYQADFNTLDQSLLSPQSELYAFDPDIIWITTNHRDVTPLPTPGATEQSIQSCLAQATDRFIGLWAAVKRNSTAYVIQSNAAIPFDRVYGNYEGAAAWGRINFLRQFNLNLATCIHSGVTILDVDHISSLFGKTNWFDERYWYNSRNACSFDAMGLLSHHFSRLVCGLKGLAKKCLVLDLDNTLWGGVIGDDGLAGIHLGGSATGEAHIAFQHYCKQLRDRGVVLCVCSKNEDENAKQPFIEHPDMVLKLEDIAVFVANWNNKADNIRFIAETLGIGLDSLVFIDDNLTERELIRSLLPMVAVPELPLDPAYYKRALDCELYFETVTFSIEDKERANMYCKNAQRTELQKQFTDINDFLCDLCMKAASADFDNMSLPRIAQLINKSNQFHLTTTRYSEANVQSMMDDQTIICRAFKLTDKFGDNGLISVVILKPYDADALIIDTFVMSCRVLSRGMEEFVCNEMIKICQGMGVRRLIGDYRPTKKNKLVANLYGNLGFSRLPGNDDEKSLWELNINEDLELFKTHIKRIDW